MILANGSFGSKEPDENPDARKKLKAGGVQVFDPIVTSGHFAHNKFAVICDGSGKAQKVLTGSTNWTCTGLCTQANNGLLIADPGVADCYLQEWNRLKDAGNGFPKPLIAANSQKKQLQVDGVQVTPWFAPTSAAQDLDYARNLIAHAKHGILFLFFNPGTYQEDPERETLLQNILERHDSKNANFDANLYIRGVVNQEIANLTPGKAPVALYDGGKNEPQNLSKDVLIPANVKQQFHDWEDEALRASMVMVHSKVIVIDPFGDYPVLMTGSHNLGLKASQKNDDNLAILKVPARSAGGRLRRQYHRHLPNLRSNSYVTQPHGTQPSGMVTGYRPMADRLLAGRCPRRIGVLDGGTTGSRRTETASASAPAGKRGHR